MGRPRSDLVSRLTSRLTCAPCLANRSEHWFYTGPVQQRAFGIVGKSNRPHYKTRKPRNPTLPVTLTLAPHYGEYVPAPVSYNGRMMSHQRALFEHFRAGEIVSWDKTILRSCSATKPVTELGYAPTPRNQVFHCCNPWHCVPQLLKNAPTPTPSTVEDHNPGQMSDLDTLVFLIDDWCFRHPLPDLAAFHALFIEPQDWPMPLLQQAIAKINEDKILAPTWRELLSLVLSIDTEPQA